MLIIVCQILGIAPCWIYLFIIIIIISVKISNISVYLYF